MNLKINPVYSFLYTLCMLFCFLTFSCVSFSSLRTAVKKNERVPSAAKGISPSFVIAAAGVKNAESLAAFFMHEHPAADSAKVKRLAFLYVSEAAFEGINSDIAFAQMCLETGFLRFGGLVSEDMNNFCGLGAIDASRRGNRFNSEQEGVRAHIQHLKAYGTAEALRLPLIDPRYKWVLPKGKACDVYGLSGTWASDPLYGKKLAGILERMKEF